MDKTNNKKRILIVDDDAALVKTFRVMLTRHGYEVIEASNALPALFRVVDGAPDLIIADINMPNMDGIELIQQFKAHQDTQDIPIVVVTGSDSEETRKAAFDAGCSGYMTKPIEGGVFLAQIERILHGKGPKKP
jgi:PleD family two-component response regulator